MSSTFPATSLVCAVVAPFGAVLAVPPSPGATAAAAPDFDVQGHRGFAGRFPGNTLPAFDAAIELGVTTLELDVRVTRDRVLVVHHDARLDGGRCRGRDGRPAPRGPIAELKFEDLEGVDCRSGRRREAGARPAYVPRLVEVLALARDAPYPVRVSIEVKPPGRDAAMPLEEITERVVGAIRELDLERRATVQCFAPEALRVVERLAPDIARSVLVRRRGDYLKKVEDSGATILSPRHDGLRRSDVADFHARGIAVIPWTVNRPASIRKLVGWGVDGMISDHPERVLAALEQSGRRVAR